MKPYTHRHRLSVTVACTALAVALLTLAGCEEAVSSTEEPAKPEPEAPAEPEPEAPAEPGTTATELLAGNYEVTQGTKTYVDPLVLHSDGTVSIPLGWRDYERWWFYPERRALTLMEEPMPPVVVSQGTTLVLSQEWRTGDPLCLVSGDDPSDDTVYCSTELRRTPAPADGGQTIKTPPATQDDLPSEWVGTYAQREFQTGAIIRTYTLREDGVFGVASRDGPSIVAGSWWFDASNKALTMAYESLGITTSIFPKGWDGAPICLMAEIPYDPDDPDKIVEGPAVCIITVERLAE